MKTALFRCDAGSEIGGGHVTRSLTLADGLAARGWRCIFAMRAGCGAALTRLVEAHHELIHVSGDDSADAAQLGERFSQGFDLAVIDGYGIGMEFERSCRRWAKGIVVVEDLPNRAHECDFLLDQTFARRPSDYDGLVPQRCIRLTGSDYALLRPEFAILRGPALERRLGANPARRLFIGFGMTDPLNLTAIAMEAIGRAGEQLEVDVVLSSESSNASEIARKASEMPNAKAHFDSEKIANLMAESDLAIGGCGMTSWERCCLGLPSLAVSIARNQDAVAQALSSLGAIRLLGDARGIDADSVASQLSDMLADPAQRRTMARRASQVCDGLGTEKVIASIASH